MKNKGGVLGCGRIICFALLYALMPASYAGALGFGQLENREFSPVRGELLAIPFKVADAAKVEVGIYTPDGERIRTLITEETVGAGEHALHWDGKDKNGVLVPDEAYVLTLQAEFTNGERQRIDSRETSGGVVLRNLQSNVTPSGDIEYVLPTHARVLIRAGIRGGAMVVSLADWEPKLAGRSIQRWSGFDKDGVARVLDDPRLHIVVGAFSLPRDVVITSGNEELDYLTYRRKMEWPERDVDFTELELVRDGEALSPNYFIPRAYDRNPHVEAWFIGDFEHDESGVPVLTGPTVVRVDVPKEDRWLLQRTLFEVAFFVNYEFVSEEENGYVPLSWRFHPSGLEPGHHVMTVNVAGFMGQAGVKNLPFIVPE
ncbi:hypothetical protein CAI21_07860 [Alkalilimnicola ehrlichii]|uniref:FlgD/Vpr Ig-like domain-containing protein n=1 Tax=Alkalilimnicola ehrlichii TaxID=351052 RepID=A0A3E0WZ65_9GAMM|nr:FlgD immunoglobulin-like domain containing protein [Alkalilimnicola ehrlichii]RFA30107.1 hypothetical protein CAI21_07860 [Alkalilimnicola ehrlichii]RFA37453.1 hypothetical protein CAL65_09205 [Alkalilimnicola ehrlichii]